MTKKDVICDIISRYKHDLDAEGAAISKRRLWYILKPKFAAADLSGITHQGKLVQPITNPDYNKHFNAMAEAGAIDDTFIQDSSRTMEAGVRVPHIIIAAEKKTIEPTAINLARKLGCSCYITGGFSSVYAARKMVEMVGKGVVVLMMSDYDKSGYEIQETVSKHFNGCEVHRALITPDQIPADRLDEYFDESPTLGKHYELDVLNIHELADVFMANIPDHITAEIEAAYEEVLHSEIEDHHVEAAINNHPDVIALEQQLMQLRESLQKEYESAFVEADPITIHPFDVANMYTDNITFNVADWEPE